MSLDAARVNLHTQPLVDKLGQALSTHAGVGSTRLDDEVQYQRRELVLSPTLICISPPGSLRNASPASA
ncbi:hypothetical protein [Azohydromonas lata]|uniref:hypothetical protein n=1 Tax=Azohydromonas lata TaxID=45677 RepID=UPI0012F4CA9B|nr:hypothetical protein [Azohydromonas lata]